MPLVRIDLIKGRYSAEQREAIGEVIYQGVRSVGAPEGDRFQVFTEKTESELICGHTFLEIKHSDGVVMIQITLNAGRSLEQKKGLYKAIADGLASSAGVRREDVLINLVEVPRENWSFGNGVAQYAT